MGKAFFIHSKYNYQEKFLKACEENNIKYINSMIKRGKLVIIETEDYLDGCGNFAYAKVKNTNN